MDQRRCTQYCRSRTNATSRVRSHQRPKSSLRRSHNVMKSIMSNAAEISRASKTVVFRLSIFRIRSLWTQRSTVSVQWPLLYTEWNSKKLPDDNACGCRRLSTNLSRSFDSVLRLVSGLTLTGEHLDWRSIGESRDEWHHNFATVDLSKKNQHAIQFSPAVYRLVTTSHWLWPPLGAERPFAVKLSYELLVSGRRRRLTVVSWWWPRLSSICQQWTGKIRRRAAWHPKDLCWVGDHRCVVDPSKFATSPFGRQQPRLAVECTKLLSTSWSSCEIPFSSHTISPLVILTFFWPLFLNSSTWSLTVSYPLPAAF